MQDVEHRLEDLFVFFCCMTGIYSDVPPENCAGFGSVHTRRDVSLCPRTGHDGKSQARI